ncbi:MAG: hypothetical protein KF729_07610 [Sandaracinaceae bacterium]|nr:hypothetical protein [Sandaracinaceae bacterium]
MRVLRALFTYTFAAATLTVACTVLAGELVAAVATGAIALFALAARTQRTWASLGLMAASAGALAAGGLGAAPVWALVPAIGGAIAALLVGQLLVRHDRAIGALAFTLAIATGAGAASAVVFAERAQGVAPSRAVKHLTTKHAERTPEYDIAAMMGAVAARVDIARGTPRLLTFGYPAPARGLYAALLEERLGVSLDAIAGCVVNDEIVGRAEGYNRVMSAYLERVHGAGSLDALWAEAEALEAEAAGRAER